MRWPNRSLWPILDERDPAGGRLKAWLFVTHPGPSLLVTATLIALVALLGRHAPSAPLALRLALVMLPAQFGIGSLNDWADHRLDALAKPHKPIPRGMVARRMALGMALACFMVSVASAATLGLGVLLAALITVAAGASYDLWLKRTPAALLSWWLGFLALPLMAVAAAGRGAPPPSLLPLAALLALPLLLANALPDAGGDRRGGARTLAVALGHGGSRLAICASLVAGALLVLATRPSQGAGGGALVSAACLALGAATGAVGPAAWRLRFPLLALLEAGAAVTWLAALPAG